MLMQKIQKLLLHEYIPIMETIFESNVTNSCSAQRSIYVMSRGDEETRSYIHQVRNSKLRQAVHIKQYSRHSQNVNSYLCWY
jgi:hypothetical protein